MGISTGIFVPKKCRVGFQQREGTFTNKLAYVIYYGPKGDLRKQKSWNSWCHTPDKGMGWHGSGEKPTVDVTPYDFDNVPTSGFVLNKGHTRYSWSHFGSNRSVIRIYDPRGIEFEITPENLVGLMMHTDCSKREIQGELVYAWTGGNLMLLPCSSEEYQAAMNFTKLQGKKFSARDLKGKEGFTFVTKKEENVVYLGYHKWYEVRYRYSSDEKRTGKKYHIFCDLDGKNMRPIKSVASMVAAQVSESHHDQYATWVDEYLKSAEAAEIVDWEKTPITDEEWEAAFTAKDRWGHYDGIHVFTDIGQEDRFGYVRVTRMTYDPASRGRGCFGLQKLPEKDEPRLAYTKRSMVCKDGSRASWRGTYYHEEYEIKEEDKPNFFHLVAVYDNGYKKKWS